MHWYLAQLLPGLGGSSSILHIYNIERVKSDVTLSIFWVLNFFSISLLYVELKDGLRVLPMEAQKQRASDFRDRAARWRWDLSFHCWKEKGLWGVLLGPWGTWEWLPTKANLNLDHMALYGHGPAHFDLILDQSSFRLSPRSLPNCIERLGTKRQVMLNKLSIVSMLI